MTDRDEFVSASDLARMGYCERQVAFDASHGQRLTVEQARARDRGLKAHAAFYDESQDCGRQRHEGPVLHRHTGARGVRRHARVARFQGPVSEAISLRTVVRRSLLRDFASAVLLAGVTAARDPGPALAAEGAGPCGRCRGESEGGTRRWVTGLPR